MPAPAPVRYSLIIPTRNRGHRLERTLAAAARLRCVDPWELIVVDNGSTDDSMRVLERFAARSAITIRLVREARRGKSRALNAALAVARGEIVALTDDDCYPAEDFLERLEECFADEAVGFVAGRVLLHDPTDAPITISVSEEIRIFPPRSYMETGVLHGANLSLRREVLQRLGGFDADFGPGTPFPAEDIEVVARASAAGVAGMYHPGPVVHHHHGRKPSDDLRPLFRSYNWSRGAYLLKFVLARPTRLQYARHWYWRFSRAGRMRTYAQELGGALHYLALRVRARLLLQRQRWPVLATTSPPALVQARVRSVAERAGV